MPIYHQTYREFDGDVQRRFRWWPMIRQEWSILRKSRLFWFLVVPTVAHAGVYVLYIYAIDAVQSVQDSPLGEVARNLPLSQVNEVMFFNYLRLQSPLVLLMAVFTGGGLICNDFRYNLVEVYFSKPLSWFDYLLGKLFFLVDVGLRLTVLPVAVLLALHLFFVPSFETLGDCVNFLLRSLGFSLVITVPCAAGVLAASAVFGSQRFAAVAVFIVIFIQSVFSEAMADLLDKDWWRMFAFPVSVNRVGEVIMNQPNPSIDVGWQGCFTLLLVVTVVCVGLVAAKIRKVGVAG